jgi:hypothetical protein
VSVHDVFGTSSHRVLLVMLLRCSYRHEASLHRSDRHRYQGERNNEVGQGAKEPHAGEPRDASDYSQPSGRCEDEQGQVRHFGCFAGYMA